MVKATGISSPDEVTDIQVAYADGIPLVNYHSWYDPTTGLGYPLASCKSKKVTRLDNNGFTFHVDCTFSTEPSQSGKDGPEDEQSSSPSPPPAGVSEIPAQISRAIVGREIVLYEAPAVDVQGQSIGAGGIPVSTRLMPSAGNRLQEEFEAPVTRMKPLLQYTITQFEDSFSDQKMMDRCFKVNDEEWRGFQAGSCMITAINAVKQRVQMDSGPEDKFRVSYTVMYDDYSVRDNNNNELFVGHNCALPLISRSFLEGDDVKYFVQEGTGMGNLGLIDSLGAAKPQADQQKAPDYVRFDTVDSIEFDFLPQ